jgi:hypothetical protein
LPAWEVLELIWDGPAKQEGRTVLPFTKPNPILDAALEARQTAISRQLSAISYQPSASRLSNGQSPKQQLDWLLAES